MQTPPSPARANFTLITECTPESSGCNSVYSVPEKIVHIRYMKGIRGKEETVHRRRVQGMRVQEEKEHTRCVQGTRVREETERIM